MTYKIATLEFNEESFKGRIAVYPNCSTFEPGYILRAGPPNDDWTGLFQVRAADKRTDYRLTIELREKDLSLKSVVICRYPHNSEAPHNIQSSLVNTVRKKFASLLGRKVGTIKVAEPEPRGGRNLMNRKFVTRKV